MGKCLALGHFAWTSFTVIESVQVDLEPNKFSYEAHLLGQQAGHSFCEYLTPKAAKMTRVAMLYSIISLFNTNCYYVKPRALKEQTDSAIIGHSFEWLTTISGSFHYLYFHGSIPLLFVI